MTLSGHPPGVMKISTPTSVSSSALGVLFVLSLVLSLAACSSEGKATGTAPSDGFPAPSKDYVFNVAADVLRKQGLSPSMEDSSRQTWMVATHWKNSPAPFSGRGYRQRATVKILDIPGRPGFYFTETQVVQQTNANMTDPSNMFVADWGDETRSGERELMINQRIEMQFLAGQVSGKFRQKYGMGAQTPYRIDSGCVPCPDASPAPEERCR